MLDYSGDFMVSLVTSLFIFFVTLINISKLFIAAYLHNINCFYKMPHYVDSYLRLTLVKSINMNCIIYLNVKVQIGFLMINSLFLLRVRKIIILLFMSGNNCFYLTFSFLKCYAFRSILNEGRCCNYTFVS